MSSGSEIIVKLFHPVQLSPHNSINTAAWRNRDRHGRWWWRQSWRQRWRQTWVYVVQMESTRWTCMLYKTLKKIIFVYLIIALLASTLHFYRYPTTVAPYHTATLQQSNAKYTKHMLVSFWFHLNSAHENFVFECRQCLCRCRRRQLDSIVKITVVGIAVASPTCHVSRKYIGDNITTVVLFLSTLIQQSLSLTNMMI